MIIKLVLHKLYSRGLYVAQNDRVKATLSVWIKSRLFAINNGFQNTPLQQNKSNRPCIEKLGLALKTQKYVSLISRTILAQRITL